MRREVNQKRVKPRMMATAPIIVYWYRNPNPKPYILNPKLEFLNPKAKTLNPIGVKLKPKPKHSTLYYIQRIRTVVEK